ncbi:protein phosphatase 2C domain-containing protein [Flexivirga alba]|uniref:Protein phosphatase 2C domain-containing protein n=1 Tax=Flexivirga alba TaxID=702742 RepID=A0ABW2AB53_9MICO
MRPVVTSAAQPGHANEDAVALGPGVAVLVDGAGLPAHLRSGCTHTVSWYAHALADTFRDTLSHADTDTRTALARALRQVAARHGPGCDLDRGSPSGTVAAWRIGADAVEYLVLGDASIILTGPGGDVSEVTDDRLATVTEPIIASRVRHRVARGLATAPNDLREARRAAVEMTRNKAAGFWCCHHEPAAAGHAIVRTLARAQVASLVAASDGATRGYQLLGIHTVQDVARLAANGAGKTVIGAIRAEEQRTRLLTDQGMKKHDDATLVAITVTATSR